LLVHFWAESSLCVKVEKQDMEGESINRNRKSSSNDSEEKQCERLVQNEKDIGCEKDQVEIRGIAQNDAILGSAARPMVIGDEDDDLDAKNFIHQSSKHKRVNRKRKEQSHEFAAVHVASFVVNSGRLSLK
jgi:hypothetical protein